jgi:hypoxanthine-guanine phosphoribosyltransferase
MTELHPDLKRILISTDEIQARVKELADQISTDFRSHGPTVLNRYP